MMKKVNSVSQIPVNVLIDDLKTEDIRKRINAVSNLHLIA